MAGERTSRLSVEEAKKKLRGSAGRRPQAVHAAAAALREARRRPWAAAGLAFAVGVAIGASSTARRVALRAIRRSLDDGS